MADVFDGVVVAHAWELECGLNRLEIVGVNRERNDEHIIILVVQIVPLTRSYGFEPPTKETPQRGPADLASARDEVAVTNDLVLRRMQKQVISQKCPETVRKHNVWFDRFDLLGQTFAEAFPQFFIFGKLRHHPNLPLGRFT